MFEPLYTAEEMRAAEQGHDVEALMEQAGRAVAEAALRHYPEASRIAGVCGKGANGGDGRIALRAVRHRIPRPAARRRSGPDRADQRSRCTGSRR